MTIHQRPVIVPRLYAEPIARDYPPDIAPLQPHSDTEPLEAVPVVQSPTPVIVHTHTHDIEREVIHHAPSVVSPTRPVQIVVQAPERPSEQTEATPVVSPPRQQAPVEAVSPRQRIAEPENGTSIAHTPVEVPSSVDVVPTVKAEEKTSTPEIKSSVRKLHEYNGSGRRHSDEQIDEILDEYLMSGKLPKYVSDRQRRDYRKHKRLELRRMYLEQAGIQTLPGAKEDSSNVLRMAGRKAQRQKRAASGV